MASYVDLNGVRTWFDEHGAGDPLVLLHPAATDSRAWASNLAALAARFRVFTPDRRGHGRTPDVAGPMSFEAMARDTIAFIEQVVGGPARILGCSDGAVVGLHVAWLRPDLVSRLAFVAGVFHHMGWLPGVIDSEEELPEFMATSYGEVSPDGVEHFPVVVEKLNRMHLVDPTMTVDDLSRIPVRTLVMQGDDDQVAFEHTLDLYRSLPDAELAIVPGTSHGQLVEKPELCNAILLDFLCNEPVTTFAPIRRVGRESARG